jgi:poly-gamma-glutamate capsule biosynthesis protein CapA/YwtB (metallophosphatase superfamily)
MASEKIIEQISTTEINLTESKDNTVDIIFAGDFYLGGRTREMCLKKDYAAIYNDTLSVLRQKDLAVVNLENPLTNVVDPIIKVGPHLSADPECLGAIQYGGFDIVALANNHILDHSVVGLSGTLSACKSTGIKTVGAGLSASEIAKPLIVRTKSIDIAFVNITENEFSTLKAKNCGANGVDPVSNYYQIIDAKKNADVVLLIVHGGHEFYPLPSPNMVKTYRFFADLGVTAIIGHHPHCASGFEVWNGVPIFYSLGNFIFDVPDPPNESWHKGYFINLSMNANVVTKIRIYPYVQCRETMGLHFMIEPERSSFLESISEYSKIIKDEQLLEHSWNEFCESQKYEYIKNLFRLNRIKTAFLKRGLATDMIIEKDDISLLLNLLRCEAHRDASIKILENFLYKKG